MLTADMHLSKKKQLATTFMFVCFELFYLSTFQVRLDEQKRTEPNIRKTGTNPTLNRFTASVYMTTAVALNDMKCVYVNENPSIRCEEIRLQLEQQHLQSFPEKIESFSDVILILSAL